MTQIYDGTYTFNRDNWSGEDDTITVTNGKFVIHGEEYSLVDAAPLFDGGGDARFDFHRMRIMRGDQVLGKMNRFGSDTEWEYLGAVSRQHQNPAILAAIAIHNIV